MEYIRGESCSRLIKLARERGERVPPKIAAALTVGALHGLHAAHETLDEHGQSLGIVHRDVSPQNILVGVDGAPRIIDFGIARAAGKLNTTRTGEVKGKPLYMAPEQLRGTSDRTVDIYAMGIVFYELLTSRKMFTADHDAALILQVISGEIRVPSQEDPSLDPAYDAIVKKATHLNKEERYQTSLEMIAAIEDVARTASTAEVSSWVNRLAKQSLDERNRVVAAIEQGSAQAPVDRREAAERMANVRASGADGAFERETQGLNVSESPSRTNVGGYTKRGIGTHSPLAITEPLAINLPEDRARSKWVWVTAVAAFAIAASVVVGAVVMRGNLVRPGQAGDVRSAAKPAPISDTASVTVAGKEPDPSAGNLNPLALTAPATTASTGSNGSGEVPVPPTTTAPAVETKPKPLAPAANPGRQRPAAAKPAPAPAPVAPSAPAVAPKPAGNDHVVDCSRPTYIDANGRTKFKPECL
jgi:serine/threonine-protein kinase